VQRIVELQVDLARREVREMAVRNLAAAGSLAMGAALIATAMVVGIPVLLVVILPWHWEVAAIWIVLYLLVGALAVLVGKARLRIAVPPKTLEALKENREWVLRQIRSARS
jgi:hypothetical protein